LPLRRFVEALVNSDPHQLVVYGQFSDEEVRANWIDVVNQYTEAVAGLEFKTYLALYRETSALRINVELAENLIELLSTVWNPSLCTELNRLLGTKLKLEGDKDWTAYEVDLKAAANRVRAIRLQLGIKLQTFEALRKKHEAKAAESGGADKAFYAEMLILLSNHAGYQLTDRITVRDYCLRVKQYTKFVESSKLKTHG
jgi:hypothetical protein